jgi:hypothetical protein
VQAAWALQADLENPVVVLVGETTNSSSSWGGLPVSALSQDPPSELHVELGTIPAFHNSSSNVEGTWSVLMRVSHTNPDSDTPATWGNWTDTFFNSEIMGKVSAVEERSLSLMHAQSGKPSYSSPSSTGECAFDPETRVLCVEPGKTRTLVVSFTSSDL